MLKFARLAARLDVVLIGIGIGCLYLASGARNISRSTSIEGSMMSRNFWSLSDEIDKPENMFSEEEELENPDDGVRMSGA